MTAEYLTTPVDPESADRLARSGLTMGLVDSTDTAAFALWLQAESRGFHGARMSDKSIKEQVEGLADRRTTGVWDATAADPESPVSTVSSWPAPLTIPGRRDIAAWAISAVTVSPTHRRRGVARAMLEAELRTANRLGVPLAILTVSEATIYSRYGFAPTAMTVDLKIDTRRASWSGPEASGRLHFVDMQQLRSDGRELLERVRLETPGEVGIGDYLWERLLGQVGDEKDTAKSLRAVRYDDADGTPAGFAIYSVTETDSEAFTHTAEVKYLVAATDDAYAGLWRYFIEMDLVTTVSAPLRSTDEAVVWQVSDFRAANKTLERDHLWARILNVPVALAARQYSAAGTIVLDITDPLGFTEGRVRLDIADDGSAEVTEHDGDIPEGAAGLSLTVNELGALYLGGVSSRSLLRAGRVTELTPSATDVVDASFRSPVAPLLSYWF
ncbi:MAG TPA: GNAT family N-acetyltransferase [Glaciihabitans sp.]|jgi:predicted acetyltransferase|nr:GNAT family N-acetyltransferase [Glaciihabitans sp.]